MPDNNKPTKPNQTITAGIHDSPESSFVSFKKDPRIGTFIEKKSFVTPRINHEPFLADIQKIEDEEIFLDELRYFKRSEHENIIHLYESEPLKNRPIILKRISEVAETLVMASIKRVALAMTKTYGLPSYLSSYKQIQEAHLAIVCMGKFGAMDLNYHSDLDLIFVFSNRGETIGRKSIDNTEFFIKTAQKFINTLSIQTSAGRCYQIDTELRPSGNKGTLVTSYDYFIDHQMNHAQHWERQALLRARPLCDNADFQELLSQQIEQLCFHRDLPPDFSSAMDVIRSRVLNEKAKESDNRVNLKLGLGSIMDIEFIIHNIQLRHAKIHPDLAQKSFFDLFLALAQHNILSSDDLETLSKGYLLFRTLESQLQLDRNRSESILDLDSDDLIILSEKLNLRNATELRESIVELRQAIRIIYDNLFKRTP